MQRMDPLVRFMQHVAIDPESGCWNWTGYRNPAGYGTFGVGSKAEGTKRKEFSHRWSYAHHVGPIPERHVIDHLCRNKSCCNPEHLDAVPQRENLMRGQTIPRRNAEATHCKHGHELAGENVRITKQGWRTCRVCHREYNRGLFRQRNPDAPRRPSRIKQP